MKKAVEPLEVIVEKHGKHYVVRGLMNNSMLFTDDEKDARLYVDSAVKYHRANVTYVGMKPKEIEYFKRGDYQK